MAGFDLHPQLRQQLVADRAFVDVDAGADQRGGRDLARRGDEAEQIGEMDRRRQPFDRAEGGGEIGVRGGESAAAGDAVRAPVDFALPADAAVDQSDHADGEPGQLLGLIGRAEGDAGNVEQGIAAAAVQRMIDLRLGDAGAGLRIGQRAAGVDPAAGHVQAEVAARQGIEAIGLDGIGDHEAAVERQPAAAEAPAAFAPADQQRHVGEAGGGAGEAAVDPALGIGTGELGHIEPVRAAGRGKAHHYVSGGEIGAGEIEPEAIGIHRDGRSAERSGEPGRGDRSASGDAAAAGIDERASDRA